MSLRGRLEWGWNCGRVAVDRRWFDEARFDNAGHHLRLCKFVILVAHAFGDAPRFGFAGAGFAQSFAVKKGCFEVLVGKAAPITGMFDRGVGRGHVVQAAIRLAA